MLKKLFEHKKAFVVLVIVLLLLAAILIGILARGDSKESGKSNTGVETEADKNVVGDDEQDNTGVETEVDKNVVGDKEQDTSNGLSVGEESNEKVKEYTDASGSWEDDDETTDGVNNGSQTGNSNQEDATDVTEQDTLSDDKKWGDIY